MKDNSYDAYKKEFKEKKAKAKEVGKNLKNFSKDNYSINTSTYTNRGDIILPGYVEFSNGDYTKGIYDDLDNGFVDLYVKTYDDEIGAFKDASVEVSKAYIVDLVDKQRELSVKVDLDKVFSFSNSLEAGIIADNIIAKNDLKAHTERLGREWSEPTFYGLSEDQDGNKLYKMPAKDDFHMFSLREGMNEATRSAAEFETLLEGTENFEVRKLNKTKNILDRLSPEISYMDHNGQLKEYVLDEMKKEGNVAEIKRDIENLEKEKHRSYELEGCEKFEDFDKQIEDKTKQYENLLER